MSDFDIIVRTERQIVVRHQGEGHEFSFDIGPDDGSCRQRVSPASHKRGLGVHDPYRFLDAAAAFAEEQLNADWRSWQNKDP